MTSPLEWHSPSSGEVQQRLEEKLLEENVLGLRLIRQTLAKIGKGELAMRLEVSPHDAQRYGETSPTGRCGL